jgi:hypothetical protein
MTNTAPVADLATTPEAWVAAAAWAHATGIVRDPDTAGVTDTREGIAARGETDALWCAVAARTAADQAATEALDALNDVIRAEVAAGVPVADIVKVTGLTRARIYQIRDHRR